MKVKDAIRTLLFKKKDIVFNQLYTKWGSELKADKVLMEYPRPQLKRKDYRILNGYWNYSISKKKDKPDTYDGKILVPFSPESVLSGVNRQIQPDEVLWYERMLDIDILPKKKRCTLHFGAVDQICELFINKHSVIKHVGGYLPYSVDITDYLLEGDNILTVRVQDSSDTSYHSRGKQKLKRGGMFYTAQSGIWQSVWLEWVPDIHIKSLIITPLVDESKVRISIDINRPDNLSYNEVISNIITVDIYDEGNKILSYKTKKSVMDIPIPDFIYWSPENPHLYQVIIKVGEDVVSSYFGMRKVEVKEDEEGINRIFLNNKPYFQNGLLDQGYWPDGLYTAPSDDAMIFDIEQAKALGFNMLRKHIKIEPLRWYYHCDRLGMLVWQDMVNGGEKDNKLLVGYLPTLFPGISDKIKDNNYRLFGRKNEEGRNQWLRECEETVRLLYNSPSIVAWVPFNEGWGQFGANRVTSLIQSIDKTRLVDQASGWYDQKGGDFMSIHNYFHPLKYTPDKTGNNRAVVLSELGGYACYIPKHSYSPFVYGYRVYMQTKDLEKALLKLYKDIERLKNEGLSAVVYTQLSDIEDEVNGLFTYDRKVCKITKQLKV
nr:glycoside hydrolase family 2 [Clostridiales bacterium]